MAYQAPRKKKEWWETALDWVGQTADKIIPGDQSSWHSGGNNQPSTPKAAPPVQPTVRVQQPQTPLSFSQKQDNRSIFGNQAMDLLNRNQNPQGTGIQTLELPNTPRAQGQDAMRTMELRHTGAPQIVQPLNKKAIDERLDKGYSWEKIAKETNTDLNRVKQYSQKTRPNYGIAPKKEEPKHEFYDYRMEKVGNKKLFGLDVGQFMGDYGDINKMHVDQKVSMTKDDLIKGFDYISRENAKNNTGKQTRDLYVNKLRDMAENGDERAKFTLKTLKDAGKLEGDWTDFIDSANKKFYGGLQQSGARAIEYLPGDQGTGKWADEQEKLNRAAVERGKQGEVAGQVMRTGLDIGTMITPVGLVDKAVKGTRAVQGLSNWNRGAGFVARTLPGSAVATGIDIASQDLQGNEQNIAKSAALGTAIDLGLPVAGKVVSKIPGVEQAGKFVVDQAGNLVRQTGNVIEAGKNNVREIRNSVDDLLDNATKQFTPPKQTVKVTGNTTKTTDLTPNTPRSDVKPFSPTLQPETKAGIDDLIARSEATPVPEGHQRVFQSNAVNGEKTNWVFDDVDSLTAYKNNTTNPGDTFEFIDVPQGSLKLTGNGEHVFTIADAPAPRVPETSTTPRDKRAIDPSATMERLRQRAENPLPPQNIAEAYNLKPDTVERLVRDYGVDKTRSIIQRSSDASNIRNMDAFVISQAQKTFGKVNPPAGKIRVKNGEEVVDTPPIEAYDDPVQRGIDELTELTKPTKNTVRIGTGADSVEVPTELAPPVKRSDTVPPTTPDTPPIRENVPPVRETNLGRMAETFYDTKQGNQKIRFAEIENLGRQITREIDDQFKAVGSDFSTVARNVEEARRNGAKSLDEVNLTNAEKDLWRKAEAEMDYVRRRASLGRKEVSEGDFGEMYFPNQAKDAYPTRDSLFEGFRDVKPGNEFTRQGKLQLDEMSFDPDVVGGYVTRYADTKLLQEERIYRAMAKNNPDLPEEQVRKAAQEVINVQNDVNKLATKVKLTGKKVTVSDGKVIDTADRMRQVGEQLGKEQHIVTGTPRGLTNGDRINSVDIQYKGEVHTVGDFLGLNQYRDSLPFTGTQLQRAGGDRNALADMVAERLNSAYRLPAEDVDYLVESIRRMKAGLPEEVVMARVNSVYRNAAKSQLMEQLQHINIQNKTLRNDVSRLANQILREGTITQELSAKITQNTLRTTNALFRKLNVSSAINELSDLTSFVTVYGKNTKLATPDFKLVKEMGVGELDPALEPFLRQVESGADPKTLLKKMAKVGGKINEGTRFYKAVETYKAAVFLKTARDFYSSKAGGNLAGDELTAKVLADYRQLALPVDAFTKTFLDDFPLFTQYMTWGARNLQKEGRLLTGQIDAGLMKDKSTMERIARDVYANIPAKTAFWLASNGLKGTTIMTAFGLTDFTGLTNQDYSGIAEEDKSWFDKTTEFTNISTIMSLINTTVQSLEKEHLKEKYKDADYNPYEHANFGDSLINTYTPQFLKNALGAQDLQEKGYSENKGGRVQYEAPEDAWNTFKSFVFGKNQTENAREYSGRGNIVDRMQDGQDPFSAMRDMAAEQIGLKDADYNRPLTDDYSEAYKAAEDGARTALLQGGRQYNDYLDNLKKEQPDLYNNYIQAMDGNHVSPEYWRNIAGGNEGGNNLDTFKMIKNRKQQLQKDLGVAYDPLYGDELSDEQVAAVLRYKSAPTGDDLAVRNTLNKEQWYKDLKARQKAFYDANPKEEGEAGFKETQRVKEWNALDDQLSSFYYDAEEIKKNGAPAWAEKFPTVFQQKAINDQYGFESEESKNFFRVYGDQYRAEKEAFDKTQLNIINQMRKIEGYPEMSWEAYQQATEIADTDGDSSSKSGWKNYSKGGGRSGGGSSISPNADVSYNSAGSLKINKPTVKAPTVKIKRRGDVKKITFKRSKRG